MLFNYNIRTHARKITALSAILIKKPSLCHKLHRNCQSH